MSEALTPAERAFLRKSCAASRVPEKVTDPRAVAQIAALLRPAKAVQPK